MSPMTHPVKRVEFRKHLCVRFCSRHAAVKFDNIAKFAIERTPARKLNADIDVMIALEQIEARNRAFRDVDLKLGGFKNACFDAAAPGRHKLINDPLGLSE